MANPLGTGGALAYRNEPNAGETRTFGGINGSRNIAVHRSNRPYAQDLCDAYNEAMNGHAKRQGKEWYVTKDGAIAIGYTLEEEQRQLAKLRSESALFRDG